MTRTTKTPAIAATIQPMYRDQTFDGDFSGADGACLEIKFENGKEILITTNSLKNGLLWMAAAHGLKQKLVDAAAISRNPENGRAASIEDKYEAVREVYERLLAGQWNKPREGGVGASGGYLFRALCRLYEGKKTPDQLREYLEGKTDAEKAALRKLPRVAEIIEAIKEESDAKRASGVDADALLGELDSEAGEE